MYYEIIKSLHIIFVVTWFAGLFYIVRLFIYDVEAANEANPKKEILQQQYRQMQKRLWYGITWPSMFLTLTFGTWMIALNPDLLKMGFMHVKLTLVALLVVYHCYCHLVFMSLKNGENKYTSHGLRLLNEVATLFLVAIVFVIVMKNNINYLYLGLGMTGLAVLTYAGVVAYRKKRKK